MTALLVSILIIAAAGLAFSGYLSYRELFGSATPQCTQVPGRAISARTCIALTSLLSFAISTPALADQTLESPQLVIVPVGCTLSLAGDPASARAWNELLSFAACIQDATVARVDRVDQLEGLVEQMQAALEPSIVVYSFAIKHGPGPVKVRAAYQIAAGQVALMTRARTSIVAPPDLDPNTAPAGEYDELHRRLEPLLESHAKLALLIFLAIDRAATDNPDLAPDVVTRNMVRSARELAALLGKSWSVPHQETAPLLAGPR